MSSSTRRTVRRSARTSAILVLAFAAPATVRAPMISIAFGHAVARWLQLAALGLVVGAVVAPALDRDMRVSRVRRLTRAASTVALFALLARLVAAGLTLAEPEMPLRLLHVAAMLETPWGRGWVVQVASVLAVLLVTFDVSSPRVTARERLVALGACLACPLTSHAMTFPQGATVGAALSILHVIGAFVWLGTLAALLLLRASSLPATLRRFSVVALSGAVLLGASGVVVTWVALGGFPLPARLLATDYGRALSLKLLLVGVILALGAWHWRSTRASARLAGGEVLRTGWLEVALAVVVLAATAALGVMPPPGHA